MKGEYKCWFFTRYRKILQSFVCRPEFTGSLVFTRDRPDCTVVREESVSSVGWTWTYPVSFRQCRSRLWTNECLCVIEGTISHHHLPPTIASSSNTTPTLRCRTPPRYGTHVLLWLWAVVHGEKMSIEGDLRLFILCDEPQFKETLIMFLRTNWFERKRDLDDKGI